MYKPLIHFTPSKHFYYLLTLSFSLSPLPLCISVYMLTQVPKDPGIAYGIPWSWRYRLLWTAYMDAGHQTSALCKNSA